MDTCFLLYLALKLAWGNAWVRASILYSDGWLSVPVLILWAVYLEMVPEVLYAWAAHLFTESFVLSGYEIK